MSDETIEKTFQVTDPARLIISNIRGSVTIQPGEENVIDVKAVKHGSFDSNKYRIEMTQRLRWQCAYRNPLIGHHIWVLFPATQGGIYCPCASGYPPGCVLRQQWA